MPQARFCAMAMISPVPGRTIDRAAALPLGSLRGIASMTAAMAEVWVGRSSVVVMVRPPARSSASRAARVEPNAGSLRITRTT